MAGAMRQFDWSVVVDDYDLRIESLAARSESQA